jgi:hypothetical protein
MDYQNNNTQPHHKIIAIHLPQFHPFKENDEWWGKGFTEWRNVVKAKPRFPGHYQPHLPADLGFYDLRVPEVRAEQAKIAKEHGIYGFCYYHYWFNGHLLMERPLEDMLSSKEPDFPFMLCWANENWTKRWDGHDKEILMEQKYSEEDDIEHIRYLIKYFKDPRYIRVNNKAVVAIYRTSELPNIAKTVKIWRDEALKEGLELYICRFESFAQTGKAFMTEGIDAGISFEPFDGMREYYKINRYSKLFRRGINKVFRLLMKKNIFPKIEDYKKFVFFQMKRSMNKGYVWYPCIFPMWDNSSRRQKKLFLAFYGSTPELFGMWLRYICDKFIPYSKDENFIFINAWNEWAEGNHLEPDMKWGDRYLKEIKKIME